MNQSVQKNGLKDLGSARPMGVIRPNIGQSVHIFGRVGQIFWPEKNFGPKKTQFEKKNFGEKKIW